MNRGITTSFVHLHNSPGTVTLQYQLWFRVTCSIVEYVPIRFFINNVQRVQPDVYIFNIKLELTRVPCSLKIN